MIVAADVIAGTAYIVGYLVDQHFMLILGVAHIGLGAFHYAEHVIESSEA